MEEQDALARARIEPNIMLNAEWKSSRVSLVSTEISQSADTLSLLRLKKHRWNEEATKFRPVTALSAQSAVE